MNEHLRAGCPRVTIITPVCNEAETLTDYEFAVEFTFFVRTDIDFEILLIDDGSSDATWQQVCDWVEREPRVRGIRLSRNFGSHIAASCGLDMASGDAATILAVDLQDPPEAVLAFIEAWKGGAQVVWGRRWARPELRLREVLGTVLVSLLRGHGIPRNSQLGTGSFVLIDRAVIDALRKMRETNRVIFAMVAWTGFRQVTVPYVRAPRRRGVSRWNLTRAAKSLYDALIGYSSVIPRLVTLAGAVLFVASVVMSLWLVANALLAGPPRGWTAIMVALLGLFGTSFLILGVLAEYLYRIYAEVMRRPLYLVADDTAKSGLSRLIDANHTEIAT